jgi:hypothetical protein
VLAGHGRLALSLLLPHAKGEEWYQDRDEEPVYQTVVQGEGHAENGGSSGAVSCWNWQRLVH